MANKQTINLILDAPAEDRAEIAAHALVQVYEGTLAGVKWDDVLLYMGRLDPIARDEFLAWAEEQRLPV